MYTYKQVSLIHRNYFALLCSTRGIKGWTEEKGEDEKGFSVFEITVDRESDRIMQKVISEENGYED